MGRKPALKEHAQLAADRKDSKEKHGRKETKV